MDPGDFDTTAGLTSLALSADGATALAVGESGTILRSPDSGAIWTPLTSGLTANLLSVALSADGMTALIVGNYDTSCAAPMAASHGPR
jgi:photosystem II stability/assembly factor-like uncharacterized protein